MKMFFEGGKQKNLEKGAKTLRDAGGITKAAARSLPKPSLNAIDVAGGVAKIAEQKDRLSERKQRGPVKIPKRPRA